jgi:hypothetical protein
MNFSWWGGVENQTKTKLSHALETMKEYSLKAYHEGIKFEESLVERWRKDGVREEKREGEETLPTRERKDEIKMRYFGPTTIKYPFPCNYQIALVLNVFNTTLILYPY